MPIGRNSFIQMTKLSNVKGRITYISSHAKQENLYAVYETTERKFWRELAKCNQEEFAKSGTEGKCIEARELIIALPESFTEYQPDRLLQLFTNHFRQNYGAECIAALHHNKRKTNYHIHLIFAERKLLDESIIKIASRNMFYDENGKHVRTKKEILGEDGEIREGCSIVKKGEVYEKKLFTAKDERFKCNSFLDEVKHSYTDLINIYVQDEKQKLQVFERGSVYLATKKIGKRNPKAPEIEADNRKRQEWNRAVDMALISGILMAGIGVISAKGALLLMGTPDNVIAQSTLYMRIYFLGMPFFMLYNYGAAILRAVGDTKRPLLFLVISGCANALLDLILVIGFHLGVAGVATATITAQMISCILVLLCLYRTDSCYQLRFSKLKIKKVYLLQIFQVGIPAGIQSTVINFSNALLQSSVNSFGSTAMAGYTAANNILGFLYVSINSVTQACMSFTSQNFGVGKYKRMDRVLIDCMILSVGAALVLGCGAYFFGAEILQIYTEEADVIQCGVEILSITTVPYFLCGIMDLFPGALRGMGYSAVPMVLSIIGTVGMRVLWIFAFFPQHRSLYFLFISYPVSWIITIILQVICFIFVRRIVYAPLKKREAAI